MNVAQKLLNGRTKFMENKFVICVMFFVCVVACAMAQTKEQVAKELRRQRIPHWEIVLAQSRLETGNYKSDKCRHDHNLFGIKHGKKYAKYPNWHESIKDYKKRISSRYKGGDYYVYLQKIGYAKDPKYTKKLKTIIHYENKNKNKN